MTPGLSFTAQMKCQNAMYLPSSAKKKVVNNPLTSHSVKKSAMRDFSQSRSMLVLKKIKRTNLKKKVIQLRIV